MTETPAGWYADPDPASTAGSLRYWDGTAWTAHTMPAPVAATPTGPTTPDGEPLAGWWWRVLAYVLDSIIVNVVIGIATLPVQIRVQQELQPVLDRFTRQIEQNPEATPDFGGLFSDYLDILSEHAFWLTAPGAIFIVLYWAISLRWKGGTPGKLMLGMRVRLREQSGTLPWSAIVVRMAVQFGVPWAIWVLALLTGSGPLLVLAFLVLMLWLIDPLWAAWDPNRQTLHDKAARTNVVRAR